ncbi:unnamed protein product [Arctogadus glacialis]
MVCKGKLFTASRSFLFRPAVCRSPLQRGWQQRTLPRTATGTTSTSTFSTTPPPKRCPPTLPPTGAQATAEEGPTPASRAFDPAPTKPCSVRVPPGSVAVVCNNYRGVSSRRTSIFLLFRASQLRSAP